MEGGEGGGVEGDRRGWGWWSEGEGGGREMNGTPVRVVQDGIPSQTSSRCLQQRGRLGDSTHSLTSCPVKTRE